MTEIFGVMFSVTETLHLQIFNWLDTVNGANFPISSLDVEMLKDFGLFYHVLVNNRCVFAVLHSIYSHELNKK